MLAHFETVLKDGADPFFNFGQSSNRRQEIAISDVTLLNITGSDLIFDHDTVRNNNRSSFPRDLSALDFEFQAFIVGRKLLISELGFVKDTAVDVLIVSGLFDHDMSILL